MVHHQDTKTPGGKGGRLENRPPSGEPGSV